MTYQEIKHNPQQFITLTSLTVEEFEALLSTFQRHWVKYYLYHTLEGKKRKLPNFRPERNTKTLPTVADKLFFLLTYLKNYPLQQVQMLTCTGLHNLQVSSPREAMKQNPGALAHDINI